MFCSKLIKLRTVSLAINYIKSIYPKIIHQCIINIFYVIDNEFMPIIIALTYYRKRGSKDLK